MACNGYVSIKIIELLLCIACMVYKRITDEEARRTEKRLGKQSYEWPLLRFITWERNGSSYADITYGSYVIITTGLLIGYLSGELVRTRNTESFLLGFGALLFIAVGSLELAAIDSVPEELIDNGAILGVVSLLTGFLFILDLLLSGKRRKADNLKMKMKLLRPSKVTQTEEKNYYGAVDLLPHKMNGIILNGSSKSPGQTDKHEKVVGQLKSSLKGKKNEGETMRVTFPSDILDPGLEQPTARHDQSVQIDNDTIKYEPEKHVEQIRLQHKLRRGDKIPKFPSHHGRTVDESDGDDSLTVPTVSFIMRERGETGSKENIRPKSPSLRSRMLPMMPIDTPDHKSALQSPKHLSNSLSQSSLSQEKMPPKFESDPVFPQEIIVMSPSEKNEFMAYKKMLQNLSKQQGVTSERSERKMPIDEYNKEIKSTYETDEIVEPPLQVTPSEKGSQKILTKTKPKFHTKGDKTERPKGYIQPEQQEESFHDFPEDLSHMTPSERERYLFGESPKHKHSISVSPTFEAPSSKKSILPKSSSGSPEEEDEHWRFDSRDANLLESFRKSQRDSRDSPSSPMDPGYVLHTAQNWPQSTPHSTPKTPSQSPTDVASGTSPKTPYRISSDESDTNTLKRNVTAASLHSHPITYMQSARMSVAPPPVPLQPPPPVDSPDSLDLRRRHLLEDEDVSPGGSLTTQLLQKWIKQRHTKVTKMRTEP